jgi:mucin-19
MSREVFDEIALEITQIKTHRISFAEISGMVPGRFAGGMHQRRSSRPMRIKILALLAGASSFAISGYAFGGQPQALPTNGRVVAGQATITSPSATSLVINQSTKNGIIDWSSFSIGSGEKVQFNNGTGATLNRVDGNIPSVINGWLSATGSVYLINPAGITVGADGRVATGGSFIASTQNVSDAAFLSGGPLLFSGDSAAAILNLGQIGSLGGNVALIALQVNDQGSITASHGAAALAAGYQVLASDETSSNGEYVVQVGSANSVASASGAIKAASIELSANGGNVYALAGNTGGGLQADGVANQGGRIFLTAPGGTVTADAAISAQTPRGGGGQIVVTGATVDIGASAVLDASGTTGGLILVGGDRGGGANPALDFLTGSIADATTTNVASGARILANGSQGSGGDVVLWSNSQTDFDGSLSAQGLTEGGFAEVSSHGILQFGGSTNLSASAGPVGTLLLDPEDVTITNATTSGGSLSNGAFAPSGDSSILSVSDLQAALATSNVTVSTGGSGSLGTQAGDITVAAPVSWSSASTLTLSANSNIALNAPVTAAMGGLTLSAGGAITATGAVNVGTFMLQSGAWSQVSATLPAFQASDFILAGGSFLRATGGAGTAQSPYLIADVYGLDGIASVGLGLDYALAGNIDASVTEGGNIGAQGFFNPIGTQAQPFTGTFNGQGFTIANLAISNHPDLGLFGAVGAGGVVENLTLQNPLVLGGPFTAVTFADVDAGAVAGFNAGTIRNVQATVTGTSNGDFLGSVGGAGDVGGLVGNNTGVITGSSSNVGVEAVAGQGVPALAVGGLVGLNSGVITGSSATASAFSSGVAGSPDVSGDVSGSSAAPPSLVGGLVGDNTSTGQITGSSASVAVTFSTPSTPTSPSPGGAAAVYAGGLVGQNDGSITSSSATGTVGGGSFPFGGFVGGAGEIVGGLVGLNTGSITQSQAGTGNTDQAQQVTGEVAGGLVGENSGRITNSQTNAAEVGGALQTGGLVGLNEASGVIGGSSVSVAFVENDPGGSVFADPSLWGVGGLVGENQGSITTSFATPSMFGGGLGVGSVAGLTVGGLVGFNSGSISSSYSAVPATALNFNVSSATTNGTISVGGLVGTNSGSITEAYAIGGATAASGVALPETVGGLVGVNLAGGTITQAYSTGGEGETGDTGQTVGGFAGSNQGTIVAGYWDSTASAQDFGEPPAGVGVGVTTGVADVAPAPFAQASYAGFDFTSGWFMIPGDTRPFLQSEYSTTITNVHQLQLIAMDPSATYVLAANLDLSVTTNGQDLWNPATGFAPIGSAAAPFTGVFNGQGFTLSNLGVTSAGPTAGLFGSTSGAVIEGVNLTNASVVGQTGATAVGLLIGAAASTQVTDVNAAGAVTGPDNSSVGGLVGTLNGGSIDTASVNAVVTGGASSMVGGLAGSSSAAVTNSNAEGAATGGSASIVGGLVGAELAGGSATAVFATGAVSGGTVGGLIGANAGSVDQASAGGDISGAGSGADAGGLIGANAASGAVTDSYATGNVTLTGGAAAGGLIGANAGTLTRTYAIGLVTATGGGLAGGLIGDNTQGAASASYWDSGTAGVTAGVGAGSSTGVSDISANRYTQSAYAGFDFSSVWYSVDGETRPILRSQFSTTINTPAQLELINLNLSANYVLAANLDFSSTASINGLWNPANGFVPIGSATTPFTGSLTGEGGAAITNLEISSSASSVGLFGTLGTGASLTNIFLFNANISASGPSASVGGLAGVNAGGSISVASMDGAVSGGGNTGGLVGQNAGSIQNAYSTASVTGTGAAGGLVGGNSGTLASAYATGAVSGGATLGGLVGANSGALSGVYWDSNTTGQASAVGSGSSSGAANVASAPYDPASYSALVGGGSSVIGSEAASAAWIMFSGDTRPILLAEASNVIVTPQQLQLLGLPFDNTTDGDGSNIKLGANINLGVTAQASGVWNPATGFVPLSFNDFSGSNVFNGQGFTISNLTVAAPPNGANGIGLFGVLGPANTVENLTLSNVNISDIPGEALITFESVGALVGFNEGGTIANVTVDGGLVQTGAANAAVGGLVGWSDNGVIANSQSSAAVTANGESTDVGGLVGELLVASVTNSTSSGVVTGNGQFDAIGGLSGMLIGGVISASFSDGTVNNDAANSPAGGQFGVAIERPMLTYVSLTPQQINEIEEEKLAALSPFQMPSPLGGDTDGTPVVILPPDFSFQGPPSGPNNGAPSGGNNPNFIPQQPTGEPATIQEFTPTGSSGAPGGGGTTSGSGGGTSGGGGTTAGGGTAPGGGTTPGGGTPAGGGGDGSGGGTSGGGGTTAGGGGDGSGSGTSGGGGATPGGGGTSGGGTTAGGGGDGSGSGTSGSGGATSGGSGSSGGDTNPSVGENPPSSNMPGDAQQPGVGGNGAASSGSGDSNFGFGLPGTYASPTDPGAIGTGGDTSGNGGPYSLQDPNGPLEPVTRTGPGSFSIGGGDAGGNTGAAPGGGDTGGGSPGAGGNPGGSTGGSPGDTTGGSPGAGGNPGGSTGGSPGDATGGSPGDTTGGAPPNTGVQPPPPDTGAQPPSAGGGGGSTGGSGAPSNALPGLTPDPFANNPSLIQQLVGRVLSGPDFYTLQISAGEYAQGGFSIVISKYGQVFVGPVAQIGIGSPVGASITGGYLIYDNNGNLILSPATQKQISDFETGWGFSAGGGCGPAACLSISPGTGAAVNLGLSTPGGGAGGGYNLPVSAPTAPQILRILSSTPVFTIPLPGVQ